MVDPNPARGMPLQLQRYWIAGKGAAKIRWRLPHDFNRCVRQLRKYFPKNPEGLCNILHQKAVGAPPGKGHPGPYSLTASLHSSGLQVVDRKALVAATELLAKQPKLGQYTWAGPLAPMGRPTGEPRRTRIFEEGSLDHRPLPLPLDWRERTGQGHDGALTVARMLGITYGPDHMGREYAWGWGDFLDEKIIPEARKARYLVEMGVAGTSVDPGGRMRVRLNPETGAEHMEQFTIGGGTLVSIPAFSEMSLFLFDGDGDWPDDDPDYVAALLDEDEKDCGCAGMVAAVNPSGWRGLPLAPREAVFDNDDAIKRIQAWAQVGPQGADVEKLRKAFMWRDPNGPETALTSYRLPVGDIINGKLTLVYHAIYAAAALLSGAHGGLPNVPDEDKREIRRVISDIYPVMAQEFNDMNIRAPWDRSAQEGIQLSVTYATDDPKEPYGDVKYADPGYQDDGKKRYPIDTADHVRAAWSYINQRKNQSFYTDEQVDKIKARIKAAAVKVGVDIEDKSETASTDYEPRRKKRADEGYSVTTTYPVEPPKAWFDDPKLTRRTPLTVTADGQVYGHLAAWGECHRDFLERRECVLAPHSKKDYAPFHLGSVLTAEGDLVRAGKIVMDTRHAPIDMGYTSTALHYDNTGDEVAVVRAGEDQFGIWVAGAVVPEANPSKVAKLRRSPISGDWRRVDGNLELTAALAVNVPAFPVYAIEDDETVALVAAGTLEPAEEVDPSDGTPPIDVALLASQVLEEVARQQEAAQRAARLQDVLEDEDIHEQRKRVRRLDALRAAAEAPVAEQPEVQPEAGSQEGSGAWPPDDATLLSMQMNARFSILDEPVGDDSDSADQQEPPAGAPVTPPAPVAPNQAPVG